jgi:glycosyltransferase involved in cell wall biosynthesis
MKEPGVEWTGTVADVRPHIQRCAVMVSPVMKTCGFLNKIAIGMASGKAVVGWKYNFSAFKHARNHEHYIGVSTTGEFVRTLAEVLGGKIDVHRIGDSACRLVREEYSWESVASQMETMYRRLRINGSGQPNTRGDRVYAHWN